MKTNTIKLIDELVKHSNVITGVESIDKLGIKYRYDKYILKYNHASNWLVDLFYKAAKENDSHNQFTYNEEYSFHYDSQIYKGAKNGKITFTKLVLL